jgi:mono/diheme cytochrome c family protein
MKNTRWGPVLIMVIVTVALIVAVTTMKEHVAAAQSKVTWSGEIAPLVYGNCTTCHHPGGAGPFSLLTYQDARRWGQQMASVTSSRYMPPWLPEPGYGDFADERRLSSEQIELIAKWVAGGMPEGDSAAAPRKPVYSGTWQYGTPD